IVAGAEDQIALQSGTYNLTVTDSHGCTQTLGPILIIEPSAITLSETHIDVTCNGGNNGSIDLTIGGGTSPYGPIDWDYDGIGDFNDPEDLVNIGAGNYNVTVTDANGCLQMLGPITIGEPADAVQINIADTMHSCGSYQTVVAGLTPLPDGTGLTYSTSITLTEFGAGQTVTAASDIASICLNMEHSYLGDLDIQIECPNGQTAILKNYPGGGGTFLGEPVDLDCHTSAGDPNCSTEGVGYDYCFTSSSTYGTMVSEAGTYTYSYTDNIGNNVVNRFYLPAGSYQPEQDFTNLIGCPINGDWTIQVFDHLEIDDGNIFSWLINFDASVNPVGFCNGSIDITPTGGTPPYTYFWSNGEVTEDIADLCAGDYCVTVSDASACFDTLCFTIHDINMTAAESLVDASCIVSCDGEATVTPIGGFAPYTYLWSDPMPQTTPTATGLCAGTYFYTITESNNNCEYIDSVVINSAPEIIIDFTIDQNILCNGDTTGQITALPTNGTASFGFAWDNGDNTQTIFNLSAGTYVVTVTDVNGCSAVDDTTIVEPLPISLVLDSIVPSTCFNGFDGAVYISVSGGTGAYTFDWSNDGVGDNDDTEDLLGLHAGIYSLTITDVNGCTQLFGPYTVTQPTQIQVFSNITNETCNNDCDGSVAIIINGGTPDFDLLWSDGTSVSNVNSYTLSNLCDGNYTLTVTDAHGCTKSVGPYIVTPGDSLFVNFTNISQAVCPTNCIDTATAIANGGSGNYNYVWETGTNAATAVNLCKGYNNITVTDIISGCFVVDSVMVLDSSNLVVTVDTILHPACFNDANSEIWITISNGTPPYSYSWIGPAGYTNNIDEDITGLIAGNYYLTVNDVGGNCDYTAVYTLINPDSLYANLNIVSTLNCSGDCDGVVQAINEQGGTMPYDYAWSNGDILTMADSLCAGFVNLTLTDAHNCAFVDSIELVQPTQLTTSINLIDTLTCFGDCDASAQVVPAGGTAPFSFEWTSGNTIDTANGLCAGWHFVTVTDANGCSVIDSIEILEPIELTANATVNNSVLCNGDCSGSVTITAAGGTDGNVSAYTFDWPDGQSGVDLTQIDTLCVGFHTVTVTDIVGCTVETTFEVEDVSDLALDSITSTGILCYGDCNGSYTVGATGGTAPYSFSWSNGDNDLNVTESSANSLCNQVYWVTVTDANFCTDIDSVHLIQPDSIYINWEIFNITCNGDTDGEITAHVQGGTVPVYDFVWEDFPLINDSMITGLSAGTYPLTFTDNNGCQFTDSAQVVEPAAVQVSAVDTIMNACFGDCNGQVMVEAIGGTEAGEYDFIWNDPLNTVNDTVVGLCDGTYRVYAEDDNGCRDSLFIDIVSPTEIQITFSTIDAACNGGTDGQAIANVSGGVGPYTYLWEAGGTQIDSLYQDLSSGWYYVTVEDLNGCIKNDSILIQDNSSIVVSVLDSSMVSCYGLCDAYYRVEASGGQAPYSYSWPTIPVDNDSLAENLCVGTYNLTVTDALNCTFVMPYDVTQPDSISLTFDSTNVACFGGNTGEAIVHVTGGTIAAGNYYSYSWTPAGYTLPTSPVDSVYSDLIAGWYTVQITDDNGCTKLDSVQIIEPTEMTAMFSNVSSLLCYGDTGTATVTPNGGVPPYTYLWDSSETDSIADTLTGGMHYVTITDANGCNHIDSIEIVSPNELLVDSVTITPTACGVVCTGEAIAYVSGGTPNYTYNWSAGTATDSLVTGLCFGNINLIVTDANNCQVSSSQLIPDDSDLDINIVDSTMIHCAGDSTGSALAVVTGGTIPYTINWSNGDMVIDNDSLLADTLAVGWYYVTVQDLNLCQDIDSVQIIEEDVLAVDPVIGSESCGVEGFGTIDLQAYGGVPPYTFDWAEVADQTEYIDTLANGMYHFTVTDDAGCQVIDSINLVAPLALDIQIDSVMNVLCFGDSTGYAIANVSGGTLPYSYIWSNGDTDTIADTLSAGWYYLTVQDNGSCQGVDSILIEEPPQLIVTLTDTTQVNCGQCDGTATVAVTGGVTPYVYDWGANAANQATPNATGLCADIYNLIVVDSNLCSANIQVEIDDTSSLSLSIVDTSMILCYGMCNGSLVAVADSGQLDYNISWYSIADYGTALGTVVDDTLELNNLCADTLKLTVVDNVGCSESVQIAITEPDSLYLNLIVSSMACYNDTSGSIVAQGMGGTPEYSYLWQDGTLNDTLFDLLAGTYRITLTDANGCFVIDSSEVITTPPIFDTIIQTGISLCAYDTDNELDLQVNGGIMPYTYLWSNDSITEDLAGIAGGTYVVTITDNAGCYKLDSISIRPAIVFDFGVGNDTIMCPGDTLQLNAWANTPQWNANFYHWISSDFISDTLAQSPYVYPDSSMIFYLTVDSICKDTASIYVQLYDTIGVYAGPDEEILKDQEVQLSASIHDSIISYLWSPAIGLSNDTIYNPVAGPKETVVYLLKVQNIYGCYEYDTLIVNVIPEIIFPTGITPNGDGTNDVWIIDYVEKFPDIEIWIFNRWGEELFYSNGYPANERWDGTYKGKDLPVGTYYYMVKLNDGIHNDPITGPITIVR
ncbi:MAG: gliding motility-associated C-terminal domain-containing protein, partial [Bacteroidales bacterium]|nr:gliding motility-associated C-terminal domain-containing protein [Bacteroidales bacterium]